MMIGRSVNQTVSDKGGRRRGGGGGGGGRYPLPNNSAFVIHLKITMVSCQKGSTHHAYARQIGPFW